MHLHRSSSRWLCDPAPATRRSPRADYGAHSPFLEYFAGAQRELPRTVLPSQPQYGTRSRVQGFGAWQVHLASQPTGPSHICPLGQSAVAAHSLPDAGAAPASLAVAPTSTPAGAGVLVASGAGSIAGTGTVSTWGGGSLGGGAALHPSQHIAATTGTAAHSASALLAAPAARFVVMAGVCSTATRRCRDQGFWAQPLSSPAKASQAAEARHCALSSATHWLS